MSVIATSPYFDALAHLPPGGVLRVESVSWDDYEQLLHEVGDYYHARIFYDRGDLEIISPSLPTERAKSILGGLISLIGDELDLDTVSLGSTTIHEKLKQCGAEPHISFYVGRIDHILGYRDLNFSQDPPPDLVIEIDLTSGSMNKLPIYRRFGVKEIWQAVKFKVHIKILTDDGYEEMSASRLFPFLTAEVLTCFLDLGMEKGESYAARAFRAWLRENAPKAE